MVPRSRVSEAVHPGVRRALAYALVLVLAVELAVWGAFLVAARPLGTDLPLAALVAVVGNVALGVAGARVLGSRTGAVIPGVLWLGIALLLGSGRPEGDAIVPQTFRGLAFLLLGTIAAAGVVGSVRGGTAPGATPPGPDGR